MSFRELTRESYLLDMVAALICSAVAVAKHSV